MSGLRRPGNEDSGFADNHLLMVADGMGGHAAGELASAMAVATFAEMADDDVPDDEVLEHLADGIDLLSERIGDVIAEEPSNQGMGTTVTGLAWQGDRVAVVHVGDSRAYRLRDGVLAQITKDHTYVQSLVDAGEITPEEAPRHPRRNLLNRAVDGIHPVEADLSMRETRAGDRYLLCTDGLSGRRVRRRTGRGAAHRLRPDRGGDAPGRHGARGRRPRQRHRGGRRRHRPPTTTAGATPWSWVPPGEPANRARLPNVPWPVDEQLDPDDPQPRGARPSLDSSAADAEPRPDPADTTGGAGCRHPPPAGIDPTRGARSSIASWSRSSRWSGALLIGWLTEPVVRRRRQRTGRRSTTACPGALGPIPLQRLDAQHRRPGGDTAQLRPDPAGVGHRHVVAGAGRRRSSTSSAATRPSARSSRPRRVVRRGRRVTAAAPAVARQAVAVAQPTRRNQELALLAFGWLLGSLRPGERRVGRPATGCPAASGWRWPCWPVPA